MTAEMTMATRFWAYRKYAEMPVGEAAHKSGINRHRLLKIETGEIVPEGQEIMSLCLVYNCSAKDIMAPEPPYQSASEAIKAYYAHRIEKRDLMAFLGLDLQKVDDALLKYKAKQDVSSLDKRIRCNQLS